MGRIGKVVFIKNAVETLGYFSEQIATEMKSQGISIYFVDYDRMFETVDGLRRFAGKGDTAFITFNFIGLRGEDIFEETEGVTIWKSYEMSIFNILVDHPLYYHTWLAKEVSGMTVFCIDREHVRYIRRFYPGVKVKFLPLAGNVLTVRQSEERAACFNCADSAIENYEKLWNYEEDLIPYHKRRYNLVFTANYVSLEGVYAGIRQLEPDYQTFYREILEDLIADPTQSIDAVMEHHINMELGEVADSQKCTAMAGMALIDLCVRSYYRGEIIRELAEQDIKVHVFGADWNLLSCRKPENIIHNGAQVDSAACVQVVRDARIALNIMPWFKDGVHDRVFTAMLQKTVALTDDSQYLRERFTNGEDIVFFSLKNRKNLPELVHMLLYDEENAMRIAENGYRQAYEKDTWRARTYELLGEFEG